MRSSKTHEIDVYISDVVGRKLAPTGRFVAWYLSQGEVIADGINFNVETEFPHKVNTFFTIIIYYNNIIQVANIVPVV